MKKFFKKPLNLVSFVLMVVGVVVMVALLVIPHGKTYTYSKKDDDGKKSVMSITLKGDKLYSSWEYDGEMKYEDQEVGEYVVNKGMLSYKIGALSYEVGKINAFKITAKDGDTQNAYTCKLNVTIMVVACAMTVVGLAGSVYGALTLKKKKKK